MSTIQESCAVLGKSRHEGMYVAVASRTNLLQAVASSSENIMHFLISIVIERFLRIGKNA